MTTTIEPLLAPRDGLPVVSCGDDGLRAAVAQLAAGTGPIAIDTERASGFRYFPRAYLIQLRRAGAGTILLDPIEVSDFTPLAAVLSSIDGPSDGQEAPEWIIHAATQDLPCLAELGLRPGKLFDTELAGRLLGYPKVSLGPMIENILGYSLAKEHSADDWSRRPLTTEMLTYAALDVELLIELRDALVSELDSAGKLDIARQEFDSLRSFQPRVRLEPWRHTSGIHHITDRRRLAAVRELWEARDRIARAGDLSPHRVLPDPAIIAIAAAMPTSRTKIRLALAAVHRRIDLDQIQTWLDAVERARELPADQLPSRTGSDPTRRRMRPSDPQVRSRIDICRKVIAQLADSLLIPAENVLAGDIVRRLAWAPPESAAELAATLSELGARPWQIDLVAPRLGDAMFGVHG